MKAVAGDPNPEFAFEHQSDQEPPARGSVMKDQ